MTINSNFIDDPNQTSTDTTKGQFSRFSSSLEDGLVETKIVRSRTQRVYIGKHLVAIASVQNRDKNRAALILEFESMRGNIKRCIISRGDLVGHGVKRIFTILLARGYCYKPKQRSVLLDYLSDLGCELPEIIVEEIDRIFLNLDILVFDEGKQSS
jgi:hypothetical protein